MKKVSTALCLLLAVALIFPTFYGCKKENADEKDDSTQSEMLEPTEENTGLEPMDYQGKEITFLTFGYESGPLTSKNDILGDSAGGVVDSSIYNRNIELTDKYNIKLNYFNVIRSDAISQLRIFHMDGNNAVDICLLPTANSISAGIEGLVIDMNTLPHVDSTKSWWYKDYNETTKIKGHNYFLLGDINYSSWVSSYCMYFNCSLARTWNIDPDEIYTLVRDGKWTLERFMEYCNLVYQDTDRDNKRSVNDTYGLYTNSSCVDALLAGSDIKLIKTNSKNEPKFDFNDKFYTFYDTLREFAQRDTTLYSDTGEFAKIDRGEFPDAFCDNRSIFLCGSLPVQNAEIRNVDFEYVFLPLPKYDEEQNKYYSWLHQYNSSSISVVNGDYDYDMLGRIIEDMCCFSKKHVRTAYYDTLLEGIIASGPVFIEMLDYIVGNYSIDLGSLFAETVPLLKGASGIIRKAVNDNSPIVGIIKRNEKAYQKKIDELVKGVE